MISTLTAFRFFAASVVAIFHMSDYSLESRRRGSLEKDRLAVDFIIIRCAGYIRANLATKNPE